MSFNMRSILSRIACLSLLGCATGALVAQDRSDLACIQELAVPAYSSLIWQARITGTATVQISLSATGSPTEVRVQSPHVALTNWLSLWFKKSSFLPVCGGKTLNLTLVYRLEGANQETPDNRIVIRYPATIDITAHPPIPHVIVD
jgi:hypothetical protein